MKALAKSGAEVIALTRTQADLDSLKEEVQVHCQQIHVYMVKVIVSAIYFKV